MCERVRTERESTSATVPRAEKEQEQYGPRGVATPMLASRSIRTGRVTATTLEHKGLTQTGVWKFINKTDEEPALKALKDAAAKAREGVESMPQELPDGDRRANAAATEGTSCVWCPVRPRSLMPRKKAEAEQLLK